MESGRTGGVQSKLINEFKLTNFPLIRSYRRGIRASPLREP